MRLLSRLMLTLLVATVAWGQTTLIKGIKIKETSFDPATHTVKLVFINDRAADITAYHYCIKRESTDATVSGNECVLVETLLSVLDLKAQRRERPWLQESGYCSMDMCNAVHPGQERTISKDIGYRGVFNGTVSIDLVVWSDRTYEGDPSQLETVIAERSAAIQRNQFISATIKDVLANAPETTLVATTITALQQEERRLAQDTSSPGVVRKLYLAAVIDNLKRPNNDQVEGVPENQRAFLTLFLNRHNYLAAEIANQTSLRKVGDQ